MPNIAIIGAGTAGNVHAQCYANIPNAKILAIIDTDLDAAKRLADRYNAEAFTLFDEMISKTKIDAVDICVPTPFHKEYVIKSAENGCDIICEKPLARTLEDCAEIKEAVNKAGIKMMVAHVLRFFPEFTAARKSLNAGSIGKPVVVRTTRGGEHPTKDWYKDYNMSGGVVLDLIIHDFDWLIWCFGEVERVFAKGLVDSGLDMTDYALVTIRFKSGVIAHVEGSWAFVDGFRVNFEIAGDKGLIDFDMKKSYPINIVKKTGNGAKPAVAIPESPTLKMPYQLELEHFIDCLENNKQPDIGIDDGINALRLSLAALESIRTGQPVIIGGV